MRAKKKRDTSSAFVLDASIENGVVTTTTAEEMPQDRGFGGLGFGALPVTLWEATGKFIYIFSASLAKCILRSLL